MRSVLFSIAYWALSIAFGLTAGVAALVPGREATARVIVVYTRWMIAAMRLFAGIAVEVRGLEYVSTGPLILASKHQSWGDGFSVYAFVDDVVVVIGEHMEKLPLVSTILRKLRAVVVRKSGGRSNRLQMKAQGQRAREAGCRILIYPEGALAKVGEKFEYRPGVWHMQRDFDMPVVPIASNLGLFWPQKGFAKHPGTATVEFLAPIPPGLPKTVFMERLETLIEVRTAELIAQARGTPMTPAVRVPDPEDHATPKRPRVRPG